MRLLATAERALDLHRSCISWRRVNAPTHLGEVNRFLVWLLYRPPLCGPAWNKTLGRQGITNVDLSECHLLNHLTMLIQHLRLEQQIVLTVRTQTVAISMLITGRNVDNSTAATRHACELGFDAHLIMRADPGSIRQQQTWKTISPLFFKQDRLILRNQALHLIVDTQILSLHAIKHLKLFMLDAVLQHVSDSRGLNHRTLLIGKDATVVQCPGSLLNLVKDGRMLGRLCDGSGWDH